MKKGVLLYWSVSELVTTTDEMRSLGFEDFVPRNDFRSAMIKAIRDYTKGNEKLYRRFDDTHESVSFGVFVQSSAAGDVSLQKEVIIKIDKKTGAVSHRAPDGWDASVIQRGYDRAKKTLDSTQFRNVVLAYMKDNNAISMRPSGGIYFVDEKFEACLTKMRDLFDSFAGSATLYEVEIYDDANTLIAIEDATSAEVFGEIEDLVKEVRDGFDKGTITRRRIESRHNEAVKILAKIKLHETNLRSKAKEVKEKLLSVETTLQTILAKSGDIVEPGEFASLLESL